MYCICCKKNNVFPNLRDIDVKTEEDALWGKEKRNYGEDDTKILTIDNKMIDDGIIQIINAGYGSKHDTDQFIIAICDDCITSNLEDGTLLYYDNYMVTDQHVSDDIEKSKKIYRRRKNLDGLV